MGVSGIPSVSGHLVSGCSRLGSGCWLSSRKAATGSSAVSCSGAWPDDCRYLQPSQFHQSQEYTTHQLTQARPPILLPCCSHAASPRQSQTTQVYEMTGPFGHASIIMWVMRGGQSSLT